MPAASTPPLPLSGEMGQGAAASCPVAFSLPSWGSDLINTPSGNPPFLNSRSSYPRSLSVTSHTLLSPGADPTEAPLEGEEVPGGGLLHSLATADTVFGFPPLLVSGQPQAPPPPWMNPRRVPHGIGGCSGQWMGRAVVCRGWSWAAAEGWTGVGGGAPVKVDWKR